MSDFWFLISVDCGLCLVVEKCRTVGLQKCRVVERQKVQGYEKSEAVQVKEFETPQKKVLRFFFFFFSLPFSPFPRTRTYILCTYVSYSTHVPNNTLEFTKPNPPTPFFFLAALLAISWHDRPESPQSHIRTHQRFSFRSYDEVHVFCYDYLITWLTIHVIRNTVIDQAFGTGLGWTE